VTALVNSIDNVTVDGPSFQQWRIRCCTSAWCSDGRQPARPQHWCHAARQQCAQLWLPYPGASTEALRMESTATDINHTLLSCMLQWDSDTAIEQGLTSHQTHYRSYRGTAKPSNFTARDFTRNYFVAFYFGEFKPHTHSSKTSNFKPSMTINGQSSSSYANKSGKVSAIICLCKQ